MRGIRPDHHQKEEGSPGFGLVVALAAVVLAGLVMVRRRP
ncbi:MAG: PGF-CTERM sorting domain-containing protein [Thermoplasmata archaeon]|nr:PGF-CTERM sorting domain-containing protein [Thermoplasmata archaeon]